MKTITTLDLRKRLGSVLDAVAARKERVMISRANKPLAVLISVAEYQERIQRADRGSKLRDIAARMDAWKTSHRKQTAAVDVVGTIRQARERR
jgi:prevent-host-death family protein